MPAKTFDNVKGSFPIGFKIWNTNEIEPFQHIGADLYDENGQYLGIKNICSYDNDKFINDWIKQYRQTKSASIATIIGVGSDFQNQRLVRIARPNMKVPADNHNWQITQDNLLESSVYFAVRHCIEATWLNDRDQFLYPNDGWQADSDFQNDCLAYTLFSNGIQSQYGSNNWIPFTEQEVKARTKFDSNLMTQFIAGKLKQEKVATLFDTQEQRITPLIFSAQAQAVFSAGLALWQYYHQQPNCNVNASYYDIREHFQGRNVTGKMNNKSADETYTGLIKNLREQLKLLQKNIEPKVYEYGFLK